MKKNLSSFAALAALAFTANHNILALPTNAANTETVVIGANTWTFKTVASLPYDVAVGVDAATSITNLVTAVNSTTSSTNISARAVAGGVLFIDQTGRGPLACSETLAGANNAWLAANTFGASSDTALDTPLMFSRVAVAAEDTGKLVAFALPFTPTDVIVQVRSSAGVIKAWDGKLTFGAGFVLLNSDGAADIATNDVVTILVTV